MKMNVRMSNKYIYKVKLVEKRRNIDILHGESNCISI